MSTKLFFISEEKELFTELLSSFLWLLTFVLTTSDLLTSQSTESSGTDQSVETEQTGVAKSKAAPHKDQKGNLLFKNDRIAVAPAMNQSGTL